MGPDEQLRSVIVSKQTFDYQFSKSVPNSTFYFLNSSFFMTYELKSEKFSGPLEKLLELIEAKELEITEISLAKVTDSFLRYLETLQGGEKLSGGGGANMVNIGERQLRADLRLLADFVAIASRLVLIKSKLLLPDLVLTKEEELEIEDLKERLKMYQELKPAMKVLADYWRKGEIEYSREYFLNLSALEAVRQAGEKIFYPSNVLTAEAILTSITRIFESFEKTELESQTIKTTIVTLEEKIKEIVSRLQKESELILGKAFDKKSISEIVVIFLAILHLAREQLVSLKQSNNFSDIIIKRQ